MFDANTIMATLGLTVAAMAMLSLVLSRIIPDDYDHRTPARQRRNR